MTPEEESKVYFDRLSAARDIHGYVRFARLLVWPAVALLIAVAIAIGLVLTAHPWSAS